MYLLAITSVASDEQLSDITISQPLTISGIRLVKVDSKHLSPLKTGIAKVSSIDKSLTNYDPLSV